LPKGGHQICNVAGGSTVALLVDSVEAVFAFGDEVVGGAPTKDDAKDKIVRKPCPNPKQKAAIRASVLQQQVYGSGGAARW
jgi:hypothetical protein